MNERIRGERLQDAPERFDQALVDLQQRLGYRFTDIQLLQYAVTRDSSWESRGVSMQSVEHTQKKLELEGDRLLREKINVWRKKLPGIKNTGPVDDFFNSNLYFSTLALRLGLQNAVRADSRDFQSTNVHRYDQKETIAAVFEACIGAVARDAGPNADDAIDEILQKLIFSDRKTQDVYLKLCAGTAQESLKIFQGMVKGTANIKLINFESKGKKFYKARLSALGLGAINLKRGRDSEDLAVCRAIIKFLAQHPWILWGYEGKVSIRMPMADTKPDEPQQKKSDPS